MTPDEVLFSNNALFQQPARVTAFAHSAEGDSWNYCSHDHARSRAYRWGEDGLLGITDRECRLCFALALWNGKDPILKERLFGLTGPEIASSWARRTCKRSRFEYLLAIHLNALAPVVARQIADR
jgi:hypothetical protein